MKPAESCADVSENKDEILSGQERAMDWFGIWLGSNEHSRKLTFYYNELIYPPIRINMPTIASLRQQLKFPGAVTKFYSRYIAWNRSLEKIWDHPKISPKCYSRTTPYHQPILLSLLVLRNYRFTTVCTQYIHAYFFILKSWNKQSDHQSRAIFNLVRNSPFIESPILPVVNDMKVYRMVCHIYRWNLYIILQRSRFLKKRWEWLRYTCSGCKP